MYSPQGGLRLFDGLPEDFKGKGGYRKGGKGKGKHGKSDSPFPLSEIEARISAEAAAAIEQPAFLDEAQPEQNGLWGPAKNMRGAWGPQKDDNFEHMGQMASIEAAQAQARMMRGSYGIQGAQSQAAANSRAAKYPNYSDRSEELPQPYSAERPWGPNPWENSRPWGNNSWEKGSWGKSQRSDFQSDFQNQSLQRMIQGAQTAAAQNIRISKTGGQHPDTAEPTEFGPEDFLGNWVDSHGNSVLVYSADAFAVVLTATISRPTKTDITLRIRLNDDLSWTCGNSWLDDTQSSVEQIHWVAADSRRSVWTRGRK